MLRKGVRCLEIDLWNGNDGTPDVTHGNTLCTKIKLEEVLKVIANNTGSKSANLFPVILSLEDHCSIGTYVFYFELVLAFRTFLNVARRPSFQINKKLPQTYFGIFLEKSYC